MRVGELFAGIGGLGMGLERAGMTVKWQVEKDEFCRRVLAKHWPDVPRYEDVHDVGAHNLEPVDLICGGFPCQDISAAGKGRGIDGARSGLWSEYARIVRELRPRFVLVENSPALTYRGLGRVLGDLAALGYDAEWSVLSACRMGAPHTRERLFIVAHTNGDGLQALQTAGRSSPHPCHADGQQATTPQGWAHIESDTSGASGWGPEPGVGRVADGIPDRAHRIRALGNAVVPQVAQWIGERIMEAA